MIDRQTFQSNDYINYLIRSSPSSNVDIEEIDKQYIRENLLYSLSQKQYRKPMLYLSFIHFDPASNNIFEVRNKPLIVELTTNEMQYSISEEDIVIEMLEHNFIVQMPPKKKYKIKVYVRSVRKGEPPVIQSDEL